MLLDKEQVTNFLPHRDPFLFIDSVKEIDLSNCASQDIKQSKDLIGAKAVAEFEIREDMEILKGHFPGNPILPGVVQVEMMAQASAFLSMPLIGKDPGLYNVETLLLAVNNSKFRKPLLPGMKLEIWATITKVRGLMASYEGAIFCEGDKISEAELMAKISISPKESGEKDDK